MTTISATSILASRHAVTGDRLDTLLLRYPRVIHSEFMTHRMFSRNAASSRAIPVEKLIQDVLDDPFVPLVWGKNQKGMQAGDEITGVALIDAKIVWNSAKDSALRYAERIAMTGAHKQIVNRLLEPFSHITVVCSSTNWSNFLALRLHKDAEPHMQILAREVDAALSEAEVQTLAPGEWHLPFVTKDDLSEVYKNDPHSSIETKERVLMKISAARCASTSYKTVDGFDMTIERANELVDKLIGSTPLHACYDSKTEVLTSGGWCAWPEVTANMELLAVDIRTGHASFEAPTALHKFFHEEELIHFTSQAFDLMVTDNHRVVTATRRSGGGWTDYGFMSAACAETKAHRGLTSACLTDTTAWRNPFGYDDAAWASLVGFFVGDGHAAREDACNPNRITFHLRKSRKIEFIRRLATRLGVSLLEQAGDVYALAQPNIGTWFRENCYSDSGEKTLPRGWLFITTEEWSALKEGLRNSDGSTRRQTWVYSSTSRRLLDQLQILAHTRSEAATITWAKNSCGRLNFSKRTAPRIEPLQVGRTGRVERVFYSGIVYCATVSTGALLVRRNGFVAVSGNSPFEHVAQADEVFGENCTVYRRPDEHGNFTGFRQWRKQLPGECQ
jgi:thymidylate synthase ThyX